MGALMWSLIVCCAVVLLPVTSGFKYFENLRDEQGRFLAGSLTQLNEVLASLTLDFPLDAVSIPPFEGILEGALFLQMEAVVAPSTALYPEGRPAICRDIQILGDVNLYGAGDVVTGEDTSYDSEGNCMDSQTGKCGAYKWGKYLEDKLGDSNYYNRYNITIDGFDVTLVCNLDVEVIVTGVRTASIDYSDTAGLDLNMVANWLVDTSVYGDDRFVEITAVGASLNERIIAYSEDFTNTTPFYADIHSCDVQVGTLSYVAQNVIFLDLDAANNDPALDAASLTDLDIAAVNVVLAGLCGLSNFCDEPIDFSETVEEELLKRPELVKEAVEPELCKVLGNLSLGLTDILVDNPLTNQSSDLIINDPFTDEGDGMPALDFERSLQIDLPEEVDLFNLTEPNFFVDLIFPNETEEIQGDTTLIGSVLEFFTDDIFPNTTRVDPVIGFLADIFEFNVTEEGDIVGLDVLTIILEEANLTELKLNFSTVINETIYIDANITFTAIDVSLDTPEDEPVLADPNILGAQTVLFPSIKLGNITVFATFDVVAIIENVGDPESSFLATPFVIELDEDMELLLEWENFFSQVAVLFALDVASLLSLHFGPLVDNLFDCLFSTFYSTPKVTGATINADSIKLNITGYEDTITYIAAEVVNILIPMYQPVLPQLAEYLLAEELVNQELIPDAFCADADIAGQLELYDFSVGLFKTVSDLATVELVEELVGFIDDPDNRIQVLEEPVEFGFELPPQNGYSQNLTFRLDAVYIEGVLPPEIRDVVILRVSNTSEFYPQGIFNLIDLASQDNPIRFLIDFTANISAPVKIDSSTTPPSIFQIEQRNRVVVAIAFSRIKLVLDLYAHFTKYAVESMELENIINLDCWQARLNESGGIKELSAVLENPLDKDILPFVGVGCACQNNLVLEALAESLSEEDTWGVLLDDINFLINAVGGAIELLYNEDNQAETVRNAGLRCEGLNVTDDDDFEAAKFFEDLTEPIVFIGMTMGVLGATTMLAFTSKIYKRRKGVQRGHVLFSFDDDDFETDVDYEGLPMVQNPIIPLVVRVAVPLILFINTAMFVVGDTGTAAEIGIAANVLGVSLSIGGFQSLSVITSVIKLWEGGAYMLAFMLFALSIFFPYFKIFCLGTSWIISPKRLPLGLRGKILHTLDILGKWSFVEFFFLIFVLIAFRIKGTSPKLAYLPEDDILKAELIIEPQISLFTFGLAVVLSLLMGNVCLIYHEKIVEAKRLIWRKQKAREVEQKRKMMESFSADVDIDEDSLRIAMRKWIFTAIPDANNDAERYSFKITPLGVGVMVATVLFLMLMLILSGALEAIEISTYGVVAYLVDFGGGDTLYTLSAFDLLRQLYAAAITPITVLLSLVFVATITIIPLVVTVVSIAMLYKPVTLNHARTLKSTHHILMAWCCVDVFIFAIAFTCLEVGTLSRSLVKSIEQCSDIGQFMQETLLPLGIIDEVNAEASCFAMEGRLRRGAYIGLFAVLFFNIYQYYTSHIFKHYISDRSRVEIALLDNPSQSLKLHPAQHTHWHNYLAKLQLLVFTSSIVDIAHTGPVSSAVNPMFAKNAQMEKARRKIIRAEEEEVAREKYEMQHPRNKLLGDLTMFLRKVDPAREHLAEALVEEAYSREGGLQLLNEKLLRKYGATVNIAM